MKTDDEDVQQQQQQQQAGKILSPPQSTGWTMKSTSPTIDVLSEASTSPPVTSSNSDGVVADCVVCGDKSSGKHYGQFSCEGCKSFFKRSIRRSLSYACRGSKNCPVDVNHRNQCQFCRLKKCVKMGMRRESVQQGRIHNGSAFLNCFFPPTFIPRTPLPFLHPFMLNFTPPSNAFSQHTDPDKNTLSAAPIPTAACPSARDIGTNFLYSTVDWVRQLSFFNMLTQEDQATLLQHNWVQLFILSTAGSSASLTFQDELNVKEGNMYMQHVERLRSMHMDLFEMNSMKAIVLFNPDTPSLQDVMKVETIQEKVQTSLDEYCRTQKSHQAGRFGRLLLQLPALRGFNGSAIESLFFSTFDKPIQVVLKELLNHPVLIPKFWPYPMFPHFPVTSLT